MSIFKNGPSNRSINGGHFYRDRNNDLPASVGAANNGASPGDEGRKSSRRTQRKNYNEDFDYDDLGGHEEDVDVEEAAAANRGISEHSSSSEREKRRPPKKKRRRRNSGRGRQVVDDYSENDDDAGLSENDEEEYPQKNRTTVTSRGRVCKPNPRII